MSNALFKASSKLDSPDFLAFSDDSATSSPLKNHSIGSPLPSFKPRNKEQRNHSYRFGQNNFNLSNATDRHFMDQSLSSYSNYSASPKRFSFNQSRSPNFSGDSPNFKYMGTPNKFSNNQSHKHFRSFNNSPSKRNEPYDYSDYLHPSFLEDPWADLIK